MYFKIVMMYIKILFLYSVKIGRLCLKTVRIMRFTVEGMGKYSGTVSKGDIIISPLEVGMY